MLCDRLCRMISIFLNVAKRVSQQWLSNKQNTSNNNNYICIALFKCFPLTTDHYQSNITRIKVSNTFADELFQSASIKINLKLSIAQQSYISKLMNEYNNE